MTPFMSDALRPSLVVAALPAAVALTPPSPSGSDGAAAEPPAAVPLAAADGAPRPPRVSSGDGPAAAAVAVGKELLNNVGA